MNDKCLPEESKNKLADLDRQLFGSLSSRPMRNGELLPAWTYTILLYGKAVGKDGKDREFKRKIRQYVRHMCFRSRGHMTKNDDKLILRIHNVTGTFDDEAVMKMYTDLRDDAESNLQQGIEITQSTLDTFLKNNNVIDVNVRGLVYQVAQSVIGGRPSIIDLTSDAKKERILVLIQCVHKIVAKEPFLNFLRYRYEELVHRFRVRESLRLVDRRDLIALQKHMFKNMDDAGGDDDAGGGQGPRPQEGTDPTTNWHPRTWVEEYAAFMENIKKRDAEMERRVSENLSNEEKMKQKRRDQETARLERERRVAEYRAKAVHDMWGQYFEDLDKKELELEVKVLPDVEQPFNFDDGDDFLDIPPLSEDSDVPDPAPDPAPAPTRTTRPREYVDYRDIVVEDEDEVEERKMKRRLRGWNVWKTVRQAIRSVRTVKRQYECGNANFQRACARSIQVEIENLEQILSDFENLFQRVATDADQQRDAHHNVKLHDCEGKHPNPPIILHRRRSADDNPIRDLCDKYTRIVGMVNSKLATCSRGMILCVRVKEDGTMVPLVEGMTVVEHAHVQHPTGGGGFVVVKQS